MSSDEANDINKAMDALLQLFPQLLGKLTLEFEILTGKKAEGLPTRIDFKSMARKLRDIAAVGTQLEAIGGQPPTPESAGKAYQLLNRMIRLCVPRIPKNKEPVEYLIQEVRRLSEMPSDIPLPPGLDYGTKHLGLQEFVCEIVASVDRPGLDTFLQGAFAERQLVSQFQRVFSKMALPKELKRPPSKISGGSVERLKLALRDVAADWDALVNLVYGLVLLKQGEQPTWARMRRVSLWDKVLAIRGDARLVPLAKLEWVTVRNSLDHGWAFFDPARETIEFPDRTRRISWRIDHAFLEGIDMYLANSAILQTWNFVQAANMQSFEAQVIALKEFAQQ